MVDEPSSLRDLDRQRLAGGEACRTGYGRIQGFDDKATRTPLGDAEGILVAAPGPHPEAFGPALRFSGEIVRPRAKS